MRKRSEVPANERRQAVLSLLRREEPAAVIARRCGVAVLPRQHYTVGTITSWLLERPLWPEAPKMGAARETDRLLSSNVRSKAETKSLAS